MATATRLMGISLFLQIGCTRWFLCHPVLVDDAGHTEVYNITLPIAGRCYPLTGSWLTG